MHFIRKRYHLRIIKRGVSDGRGYPFSYILDESLTPIGPDPSFIDEGLEIVTTNGKDWDIWVFEDGDLIMIRPASRAEIESLPEVDVQVPPTDPNPGEPVGEPEVPIPGTTETDDQPEPPPAEDDDSDNDTGSSDDYTSEGETGGDDSPISDDEVDEEVSEPESEESDPYEGDTITVTWTDSNGETSDTISVEGMSEDEITELIEESLDAGCDVTYTDGETGETTTYGDGVPDDYGTPGDD